MDERTRSTVEGNDVMHPPIPEEASTILSTLHGRERREWREISKAAFDAAIRYGEKVPNDIDQRTGKRRWLFNYKAGGVSVVTDNSCSTEVTSWAHSCWGLNVEKVHITKYMKDEHRKAVRDSVHHELWNSHAVAVVDQSGSMRKTDAENGVTRSDLVWLCLAVDYVGRRLRTGEATHQDYFSLIELGPEAKCLIKNHPFNWILYNKIIDILRTCHPLGKGNYLPALDCAKKMLLSNKKGRCLQQLVFLTDGAPSDEEPRGSCGGPELYHERAISNQIASIARQFGSRLTIGAIAVGGGRYGALEAMVNTAKNYNCQTYLKKSSLVAGDVSSAFISMSSLISSSKSRSTDVLTNCQRTFRDLTREPLPSVGVYLPLEKEWIQYTSVKKTLFNKYTRDWEQRDVFYDSGAVGIAVREHIFGEGRERAVRRVREVNAHGDFVGPMMVGKESLFVEDESDSFSFHKTFCIVQQLALKMALQFNRQLVALPGIDKMSTPRISFLNCYVMILHGQKDSSAKFLLVEKMLDHLKYKKWNNNDGYVDGMSLDEYHTMKTEGRAPSKPVCHGKSAHAECKFSIEDVPQAYSHFTYLASGRKFLVCDLQGVLDTSIWPPVFELTDPAIHYSEMTNRKDYGRTDRGEQGIQDFLKTHTCSNLCHMLLKCWINDPLDNEVIHYEDILNKQGQVPSLQAKTGTLARPNNDGIECPGPKKSVRFG